MTVPERDPGPASLRPVLNAADRAATNILEDQHMRSHHTPLRRALLGLGTAVALTGAFGLFAAGSAAAAPAPAAAAAPVGPTPAANWANVIPIPPNSGSVNYMFGSANEHIVSGRDNFYELRMQSDGNLVLYAGPNKHVCWTSGTSGSANANSYAAYQWDGNLVIARPNGTPIWGSNTVGFTAPGTNVSIWNGRFFVGPVEKGRC
jgi:hypothetical protein